MIEIERIEALEQYQPVPEGLEQSWRFEREPEGQGDLVVEVALHATLRLNASDDRGLELVDDTSGMVLRYGHGAWVDARGERVEIKSQWAGDHVELTVPEAVIHASAFPAVLDPVISAPFLLGEPVFLPAPVRGAARVLGGGGKFLAAWTYPDGTAAARVRANDGLLLDPGGIAIETGSVFGCPDLQPAVGYDAASDVFLVAYTENAPAQRIVATLIRGSDGTIINPTPIEVSAGPDCGATLARGASHYLVSWRGYTTAHIQSRRLQFDGTLVGAPLEVAANPSASYGTVTSAYAAGRFLVSWNEGVNIRAQRINEANAALLGSSLALTSGTNGHVFPSASTDGLDFVVAWVEPGAWIASVRARSIASRTGTLSPSVTLATNARGDGIDVAWSPEANTYWLAYSGVGVDILGRRVTRSLVALDGPVDTGLPLSDGLPGAAPAVAVGGGRILTAWGAGELVARLFDPQTASIAPDRILFTTVQNWQDRPAVTYGSGQYLAAWDDARRGRYGTVSTDLYATRIAADGTVLDPQGIAIAQGVEQDRPGAPAVASSGNNYLVAWNENSGIRAVRLSTSGAVLDMVPVEFGPQGRLPQAAFAAGYYLVAWWEPAGVFVQRLDPTTGALVGTSAARVAAYGAPAITCQATQCLVVADQLGTRVEMSTGQIIDVPAIQLASGLNVQRAAAGSDGTNYLVVWAAGAPGSEDLVGRRFSAASGSSLDSAFISISAASGEQLYPSVVYDGQEYAIAWSDGRNRSPGSPSPEVWMTRVSTEGVVLSAPATEGALLDSTNLETGDSTPRLASEGGHRTLAVYSWRDTMLANPERRLRGRFVSCVADSECTTGHCIDGVCCNSSCGGGDPTDCLACSLSAGAPASGLCVNLCQAPDAGLSSDSGSALDGSTIGGDVPEPADATQTPDGAEPDGAEPDGAEPDGAEPDGAEPDGAEPDGAEPDGGAGIDVLAISDASPSDGFADGGFVPVADVGPVPDTGPIDASASSQAEPSCGCQTESNKVPATDAGLTMLAVVWVLVRRGRGPGARSGASS